MTTVYISIDEVYQIHEQMLKIGGGRNGIRDFTLLHSAVERPKATFNGKFLYGTIWLQAAALMHSLIKNHPFDDGNKRTGYFATMRFLYLNGYKLPVKGKKLISFALSVDIKNLSLNRIASWLKRNAR